MAVGPSRVSKNIQRQKDTNEGVLLKMDIFRPTQKSSAIIDVWWLFDDGGLTLLLPYLLRRRKRWRNCQFRIFSCVSGEQSDAERQHIALASLLTKFRIRYTDLHVLHGLNKQPNESETKKFEQLLQTWHENNANTTTNDDSIIHNVDSDNETTERDSITNAPILVIQKDDEKIVNGLDE